MPRTRPMSDADASVLAAFDADLERLLEIEPSAQFAARVRTRIAAERPGRSWRVARPALWLAVAAALLLAVTLRFWPAVEERGGPAAAVSRRDIQLANPPAPDAHAPSLRAAAVPHTRSRTDASRGVGDPEVIVDPAVAAAIQRLTFGSRSRTLDPAAPEVPAPVSPEVDALAVAEPLQVPELVLKPADQAGVR